MSFGKVLFRRPQVSCIMAIVSNVVALSWDYELADLKLCISYNSSRKSSIWCPVETTIQDIFTPVRCFSPARLGWKIYFTIDPYLPCQCREHYLRWRGCHKGSLKRSWIPVSERQRILTSILKRFSNNISKEQDRSCWSGHNLRQLSALQLSV